MGKNSLQPSCLTVSGLVSHHPATVHIWYVFVHSLHIFACVVSNTESQTPPLMRVAFFTRSYPLATSVAESRV